MIGIGDTIFHQRVYATKNVFAGTRHQFRNNCRRELIAVSGRSAIVRLKDKPAILRGKTVPLVPVGLEVIAVCILWTAVDQHQHRQILRFELSRWIREPAFDWGTVWRSPAIRLAFG